jgi:hypothetical protein
LHPDHEVNAISDGVGCRWSGVGNRMGGGECGCDSFLVEPAGCTRRSRREC